MSGESSQEKTEEATPQKLRKARERGQVYQSRDLSSTLLLGVSLAVLVLVGPGVVGALARCLETAGQCIERGATGPAALLDLFAGASFDVALALAPALAALFLMGIVGPLFQVGPLLTLHPLIPDLKRLDPVAGAKRVFVSLQTWFELAKSLLKIVIAGFIAWRTIESELPEILAATGRPALETAALVGRLVLRLAVLTTVVFVGLSLVDLLYQRWHYLKQQRMTKQHRKEEHKDQEGAPEPKQARRRLHEEILRTAMVQEVKKADVVVTNPTHLACALRYAADDPTPRLVAKGADHLAARIREAAAEAGVPVRQDVGLARALFELELDQEVPEELFAAVAALLRWVEEVMRRRGGRPWWSTSEEAAQRSAAATDNPASGAGVPRGQHRSGSQEIVR